MPNCDVSRAVSMNKLLSKQSCCRWNETPRRSCDATVMEVVQQTIGPYHRRTRTCFVTLHVVCAELHCLSIHLIICICFRCSDDTIQNERQVCRLHASCVLSNMLGKMICISIITISLRVRMYVYLLAYLMSHTNHEVNLLRVNCNDPYLLSQLCFIYYAIQYQIIGIDYINIR